MASPAPSGFDHLSLTSDGLAESKAHLQRLGIRFDQVPVPGAEIMQLFLRDPISLLDFAAATASVVFLIYG